MQIEGTGSALWSVTRKHIVALLSEKQWIGDSVMVATMARIQSHQRAHAAEHEQSIGIDIPLMLPTLWATSIQSETAQSEGEADRCKREARSVRRRFLKCGTVPAAKVCFPVSVRGYGSRAGLNSGGHWVAVEITADREARTGSVVVHDGKFGRHVTLLTRLKSVFSIALATDHTDADTHLKLIGTTNKECPIQADGSHCACLAANALECLMLGHEVRFDTAATISMRRRRRMLLYTLQRAKQVSADVVVALQRAAEAEQRPRRERAQARVAQARADREERVDEIARAADSAYWRLVIDQPPDGWRRPISDPVEFVPGPAAQLRVALRGAQFLAGQRAQFRERWIAARVAEDSERRQNEAGGRTEATVDSAEVESREEESPDGGVDYDMDENGSDSEDESSHEPVQPQKPPATTLYATHDTIGGATQHTALTTARTCPHDTVGTTNDNTTDGRGERERGGESETEGERQAAQAKCYWGEADSDAKVARYVEILNANWKEEGVRIVMTEGFEVSRVVRGGSFIVWQRMPMPLWRHVLLDNGNPHRCRHLVPFYALKLMEGF